MWELYLPRILVAETAGLLHVANVSRIPG